MTDKPKINQPIHYEIKIKGRLDESWSEWFEPMTIDHTEDANTVLRGFVPDQAALQSILANLGNLNLALISVSSALDETE